MIIIITIIIITISTKTTTKNKKKLQEHKVDANFKDRQAPCSIKHAAHSITNVANSQFAYLPSRCIHGFASLTKFTAGPGVQGHFLSHFVWKEKKKKKTFFSGKTKWNGPLHYDFFLLIWNTFRGIPLFSFHRGDWKITKYHFLSCTNAVVPDDICSPFGGK